MTPSSIIGVFGAGGFAREVMPILEKIMQSNKTGLRASLCFVEKNPSVGSVNGIPVLSEADFLSLDTKEKYFNVAIGDSSLRQKIVQFAVNNNIKPFSIAAHSHVNLTNNNIGVGGIFCDNTIITSNSKIGDYVHLNLNSYIAHDCIIGDYVTFAPGVHCNGNVIIEDHAYIGTGAILKHGTPEKPLRIGKMAIIGMGAVVTKDVAPGTTVIGNPARPLIKNAI